MEISNLPPSSGSIQNSQETPPPEQPVVKEGLAEGTVIAANENTITLKTPEGTVVSGELKGNVPIDLFQSGLFKVHIASSGQLQLELIDLLTETLPHTKGEEALVAAGLKVTEENKTLIDHLLQKQLSIDKQTITQFKQLMGRFEGHTEKAFLVLENEIMPTAQNIALTNKFFAGELSLSKQLDTLLQTMMQTKEPELLTEWANILFDKAPEEKSRFLAELQLTQEPLTENLNTASPESRAFFTKNSSFAAQLPELIQKETGIPWENINPDNLSYESLKQVFEKIPEGTALFQKFVPSEKESPQFLQQLKTVFSSKESRETTKTLQTMLKEKLFFNPEEKESLAEFMKETEEKLNQLAKTLTAMPEKDSIHTKTFETIKQYNEFQQLLKDTHYVQIPLFTQNKTKDGELYIFKNKRNKKQNHKISCLLSLELSHLGLLESFIQKDKDMVFLQFRTNNNTQKIIEENLPQLHKMLADKNIKLSGYSFKLLEEPFQLSQKEPEAHSIKKMPLSSFDTSI